MDISKAEINEVLIQLDELCGQEYIANGQPLSLLELLNDSDRELSAARLRRLTGIMLKRHFANPGPIEYGYTATQAQRSWDWDKSKLEQASPTLPEFLLLKSMAKDLPVMFEYKSDAESTLDDLVFEASNESGLFKVLALYTKDKLDKKDIKKFGEYYSANVGRKFNALTNLSSAMFGTGLGFAAASIIGPASVAIPFALIAMDFGLDSIFGAENEKDNDN